MSAWSSGTWCTIKGPREQTLSRPPAALSRRDLPYASVLASPCSTSLHPHVKPCSLVRPPSSLSHPQSSHAASRSAAACVACSCAAPATTPTPHSPVFVGPGVDASSVPVVVAEVPFIPAPTPQHKNPKTTPPKHQQPPRQSPPRLKHTRTPSHNPCLAPTPAALSPLLRRRASRAPPSHTPPHAELSHRHAHPLPRPHQPRPHAGSCSAAACCCDAPATTPTPHSPVSVGPGVDAVSVQIAIEPLALVGIAVGELDERELPVALRHFPAQWSCDFFFHPEQGRQSNKETGGPNGTPKKRGIEHLSYINRSRVAPCHRMLSSLTQLARSYLRRHNSAQQAPAARSRLNI
jgi:hypothetical protein